ncbi:hypothetical protein DdX_16975 [Ditylenchus destructor]|uniref:Uncharacterized protein n=1 Tax=Ditylenchus destructor TaxID=166010 RepID=A0AAD4QZJ7_9BILA|nr:hypothetical protein DdX_16975 [Ditylenchus destructor]
MQSRKMAWFIFYNIDRDKQYRTLENDLAMFTKEYHYKYPFNPLFELTVFHLQWFGWSKTTTPFRAALNEMLYYEKFKMTSTPWVVCVNNGVPIYSYPLPFNILDLRAQIDAYLWEQWNSVFFYTSQPMPAASPPGIPNKRTSIRNIETPPSMPKSRAAYDIPPAVPDAPPAVSYSDIPKAGKSTGKKGPSKSKLRSTDKVPPAAPEPPPAAAIQPRVTARTKTDLKITDSKLKESGRSRPVEIEDPKPQRVRTEETPKKDRPRPTGGTRDRGGRERTSKVVTSGQHSDPSYRRPGVDIPRTEDVPRMAPQQPAPPHPHAQYPPYDPSQYTYQNDPYLNQYGSYNPQAPYSVPDFKYLAEINKTAKKIMDTLETAIQRYYVVAILFIKMPYNNAPGSKMLGDAFDSFIPVANEKGDKGRVYFEKVNMTPFLTMGLNPTMGTFFGNINGWIGSRANKPDLQSIDPWTLPHLVVFMYHCAEISIQFKTEKDMMEADKKVKGFLESHSIEYKFETDKNK